MKTLIGTALLALLAVPAFAKVTVFSNADALQQVLASTEFRDAVASLDGQLSDVSIKQRDDSNAFQAFEMTATVLTHTPIGDRNCYLSVDIFAVRDEAAPQGITATKLSLPVVQPASCEK